MIALDTKIFFNDPWWIVAIKCIGVVVLLLTWTIVNVWYERRLVGKMSAPGPIMNGPSVRAGARRRMKLLVKEDFAPGWSTASCTRSPSAIVGVCAHGLVGHPAGGEVNMFGTRAVGQSRSARW